MLARFWSYMSVNINTDDVGILVIGYRGDATMECLFTQPNVEIAIDYPNNPQETVKAPDSDEGP